MFFVERERERIFDDTLRRRRRRRRRKMSSSSSIKTIASILLQTLLTGVVAFPVAFVAHVIAMCFLPWEIGRATMREMWWRISLASSSLKRREEEEKEEESFLGEEEEEEDEKRGGRAAFRKGDRILKGVDALKGGRHFSKGVWISKAFACILERGFTIESVVTSSEKSSSSSLFFESNDDTWESLEEEQKEALHSFREKHKMVVKTLQFQIEDADERFKASVQKIRESEIQRVKLHEKLQARTRELARVSGKDARGVGGTKSEKEWDQRKSGSSSGAEMFATGCLCAYYLYCFYDVEDPFKFDRKMATLVPLFWVACLAVNSNGVNKLATVANLILTGYFCALVHTNQRMTSA